MDSDFKAKVEACSRTADNFAKLYYTSLDKKRHLMNKMYLDSAVFVWNGNGRNGKDAIQQFMNELPSSEHNVNTLDAQPIVDEAVAGQLTYLILAGGTVRYSDNTTKPFQQSFIITAQEDKWKIASDSYRIQDYLCAEMH